MTGHVSTLLRSIPDEWGPKFKAASGEVTRTHTGPNEIMFQAPCHMALVMLTPQLDREVSLNSDRRSRFYAPVGTMEIVPADADVFARWKTTKENLLVALAPETLSRFAGLEFGREDFELRPLATGHTDQKALLLANLIQEEFKGDGPLNPLYMESLLTVFSTYLLRSYSTFRDKPRSRSRGGLALKAWRDVQDYIRANIAGHLSVERLAFVAGLSPSHFLRAFRQTAGKAPHQYVLAIRLELAEQLLMTTDMSLAKIANLTGFANHSHMTSAMRHHKATTPSAMRRVRISD